MKQQNRFLSDLLDFDVPDNKGQVLWRACKPVAAVVRNGIVIFTVPFEAQKIIDNFRGNVPNPAIPRKLKDIAIQAYGGEVIRFTMADDEGRFINESVMLEWCESMFQEVLSVVEIPDGWAVTDAMQNIRMRILNKAIPSKPWGNNITLTQPEFFEAEVYPDGKTRIDFIAQDYFVPHLAESMGLAFVERNGKTIKTVFALHSNGGEKYSGTGERFGRMDLSGRTLTLENADATGTNNSRAYKNVPFYVSSKPYGLLLHTSAHIRLSLADISTRAVQASVEEDKLDLFFIGGNHVERIVYNYRRITGFPHHVPPLWSYGIWMSRLSYWTAEETVEVADKLRAGGFPCDVLHLDTGWFTTNWKCDWEFSHIKFPDPALYIRTMKEKGFRITLWQLPKVGSDTKHYEEALQCGFIVAGKVKQEESVDESQLSDLGGISGTIDFTNPKAVEWYQSMLEKLLQAGVSAIKADFGEEIEMQTDYYGMPARLLHNLYALLYQQAVYEITYQTTGEGIVWSRAAWAGCQRYPVHWGGDSPCTWDGLAGTIRGGLQLGLSGFSFWSHDVPGFYGLPYFMDSWPSTELYVRWTQMGVFTSHIRYHGAQPREPYEYPEAAPIVLKWWKLRYALLPYLLAESRKSIKSGLPIFRSMVFHHERDPVCWDIGDQYYCGDSFLVAPVTNVEGRRDIYLPEGNWLDFWTGHELHGPVWIRNVHSSLERIPIYVVKGASIPVYLDPVLSTNEMDLDKTVEIRCDDCFKGLSDSVLGSLVGL